MPILALVKPSCPLEKINTGGPHNQPAVSVSIPVCQPSERSSQGRTQERLGISPKSRLARRSSPTVFSVSPNFGRATVGAPLKFALS